MLALQGRFLAETARFADPAVAANKVEGGIRFSLADSTQSLRPGFTAKVNQV
jgi:hypothetical protein